MVTHDIELKPAVFSEYLHAMHLFNNANFPVLGFNILHQQSRACDQGRAAKVAHPRSKKLVDPSVCSPLGLAPLSVCSTAA